MAELLPIDFIFIFIYLAILLIIGYVVSKRKNIEDYLIAKRKLGAWETLATINAGASGSIFMIFVAMTYIRGFSAIWYFVGAIIGMILFIPFAIKLKKQSQEKYYTLADYFKYNYGKTSAFAASIISIFLMFGLGVINIIAGAKVFVFFSGRSFELSAVLMIFVTSIYLLLGGFRAVVKTDMFQYIIMMVVLAILTVFIFNGSVIPVSDWSILSTDISTLVGFFLIGVIFPFASPDLRQRIYSSRGKKELKNGMIGSIILYGVMALLLSFLALAIKANIPDIDPDTALLHGFSQLLPHGLLGLATVLLFAAIMSTLDTYIFAGSSSLVQDFSTGNKNKIVVNIKRTIIVFAILATIIAIFIKGLITGTYIFVAFYATLAVPVIATRIKKSIKADILNYMFVMGIIGVIIFLIISLLKGEVTSIIVIVAIASSILGLIIGYFRSLIKNRVHRESLEKK